MGRFHVDALADEHLESLRGTIEGIAFGHVTTLPCVSERQRAAIAGAVAASVWAAVEPLDRRVFGCDYSDVALLGKAVTRSRVWPVAGVAVHALNGAAFGLALDAVRRVTGAPKKPLALGMALAEHVTLWPLGGLSDRFHPARGEAGVPRLLGNRRAFAQATFRHALFGAVLGRLA